MQQTLWIVRHGNREDFIDRNWSKTAARPHDPGLSPDGEEQAREVGMGLRDKSIAHIYASPYLRTIQTANQIAAVLDLPIHLEPGIGEIMPNVPETPLILPQGEAAALFDRIDAKHSALYVPVFPEPEELAHRRAGETVQKLADRHTGENLLIVTHAAPVVGIVRHLTGTQEKIRVPLCGLFTLARDKDAWSLIGSADISHLSQQDIAQRYVHIG